nr:lysophospholipase 3 [Quercus suber]
MWDLGRSRNGFSGSDSQMAHCASFSGATLAYFWSPRRSRIITSSTYRGRVIFMTLRDTNSEPDFRRIMAKDDREVRLMNINMSQAGLPNMGRQQLSTKLLHQRTNNAFLFYAPVQNLVATAGSAGQNRSQIGGPDLATTYAPYIVECPQRQQWIRPARYLSYDEAAWVFQRQVKVLRGLSSYLDRLHLVDFDTDAYVHRLSFDPSLVPNIAFAISGGAWASSLTGTGPLRAFDARFAPARQQRTGGLLQAMTYMAGLSGGAWPIMSLATNDFPEIDDMVASWHLDEDPTFSPNTTKHRASVMTIFEQIYTKFEAGFNVSFADYLGRDLGYEFVAGPNGGLLTALSGITKLKNFDTHEMPFPLFQSAQAKRSDPMAYGILEPDFNATLFEYTPLEFGAWNGPEAFFPMQFLGTRMNNSIPNGNCVNGFDRATFILEAVGDAWNAWLLNDLSNNTLGSFGKRSQDSNNFPLPIIRGIQQAFSQYLNETLDDALYLSVPNPFAKDGSNNSRGISADDLLLVDDDEANVGQALPLWSLAQPARKVDMIIGWENPEDSYPYLWNNGTSLYNSYLYAADHGNPFPIIPSVNTILNRGYNTKPTLFGCNVSLTTTGSTQAPLILYMANAPYSSYTNYSGLQEVFTSQQMDAILTNGFNYATQGNGTSDAEWPECLGCAAIDRSLARVGMLRSEQCQRCMDRYCWDGTEDNSTPAVVDLALRLAPNVSFAQWNESAPYWPIVH